MRQVGLAVEGQEVEALALRRELRLELLGEQLHCGSRLLLDGAGVVVVHLWLVFVNYRISAIGR